MNATSFRDGIFNLYTRRFGKVAEILIELIEEAGAPLSPFHDLYDGKNKLRIEVKFSRVSSSHKESITRANVLDVIAQAVTDRGVPFKRWIDYKFDANIQQVKPAEFDVLIYGLFFADCIVIFKMFSRDLRTNAQVAKTGKGVAINFSSKQHKGNKGEGQFHVNQATLSRHLEHYHYRTMKYPEFLALLPRSTRGSKPKPT